MSIAAESIYLKINVRIELVYYGYYIRRTYLHPESNTKRQVIVTLVVLILISVVIVGVAVTRGVDGESSIASQTTSQSAADTDTFAEGNDTTAVSNATYKDGDYTATGDYSSPGGAEEITVTVTLKDGAVTATSAEGGATSGSALEYQADFIAAYSDEVIGKTISNLELDRVAGASLTANGFNDAIEQIKDQAAA